MGCISAQGTGPLHFVEGTLRHGLYLQILQDVLLPYMHSLEGDRHAYTFMQDGAPCHTAAAVKKFFGKSLDMNPIENCWARLKQLLYDPSNPNLEILRRDIEEIWNSDESLNQIVKNCVSTMPHRIRDLLHERSGGTKYGIVPIDGLPPDRFQTSVN